MAVSIAMAFRNEGCQVKKTIDSLFKSIGIGCRIEIVVVNDSSDDNYDYSILKKLPGVNYIENTSRLGSSESKNLAVSNCRYDNILLIDAHMRFIDYTWYDQVESYIKLNPRSIGSLYTIGFDANTEELNPYTHSGTFIRIDQKMVFGSKWSTKHLDDGPTTRIACLMGAAYFFSKSYWDYLKGYDGLRLYGREEEYLSIKSWGLGDGVYLVKDCKIAHLYRSVAPQPITTSEVWENIGVILRTLLPKNINRSVEQVMKSKYSYLIPSINERLERRRSEIESLRQYYIDRGFDYSRFLNINNEVKNINRYDEDCKSWE